MAAGLEDEKPVPKKLSALFCPMDSPPTYHTTSVSKRISKTAVPFYIVRMGSTNVPEKLQLCFVNVVCEGWL